MPTILRIASASHVCLQFRYDNVHFHVLESQLIFTNEGQKLPSLKQAHQWWQYGEQGKLIIQFLTTQEEITLSSEDTAIEKLKNPPCDLKEFINPDHHPKDRFIDRGNDLLLDIDFTSIGNSRRQSEGLPPSFIQKICLNNIFAEDYGEADFTQALHGLDYIRDIEVTRRAALREAAQRLEITKENWREVLAEDPDAKQWVENMQGLEVDISTYYATIFIDLRIWVCLICLHLDTLTDSNADHDKRTPKRAFLQA
jgi:hypothetical protein